MTGASVVGKLCSKCPQGVVLGTFANLFWEKEPELNGFSREERSETGSGIK